MIRLWARHLLPTQERHYFKIGHWEFRLVRSRQESEYQHLRADWNVYEVSYRTASSRVGEYHMWTKGPVIRTLYGCEVWIDAFIEEHKDDGI